MRVKRTLRFENKQLFRFLFARVLIPLAVAGGGRGGRLPLGLSTPRDTNGVCAQSSALSHDCAFFAAAEWLAFDLQRSAAASESGIALLPAGTVCLATSRPFAAHPGGRFDLPVAAKQALPS
jgi:hypothetical protein